jgi:hypothetical protein
MLRRESSGMEHMMVLNFNEGVHGNGGPEGVYVEEESPGRERAAEGVYIC